MTFHHIPYMYPVEDRAKINAKHIEEMCLMVFHPPYLTCMFKFLSSELVSKGAVTIGKSSFVSSYCLNFSAQ